ncbi:MAG: hypothetical protein MI741_05525 [Rhodospirillales bacterium]|nr:hypothetical protein [Rhodospirillales bacterium]
MKTARSVQAIQDWLDDNCQGEHEIILLDIDDELMVKVIRIMFELEEDKRLLANLFQR